MFHSLAHIHCEPKLLFRRRCTAKVFIIENTFIYRGLMATRMRCIKGSLFFIPRGWSNRREVTRCARGLPLLMSLALLFALSSIIPLHAPLSADLEMLIGDILTLYISPPVENLSAVCQTNRLFRMYLAVNEGSHSLVQVQPVSPGFYNITIAFQPPASWGYSLGVLTADPDLYTGFRNATYTREGYFIEFLSGSNLSKEINKFSILVNAHTKGAGGGLFDFELPKSINAVFFVAALALISYSNAFFIISTYFQDKAGGVSRRRWIGLGILVLVSAFAIYRIYILTTFTLGGE